MNKYRVYEDGRCEVIEEPVGIVDTEYSIEGNGTFEKSYIVRANNRDEARAYVNEQH